MANFSLLAKIGLDSKGFQKGLDKAKTGVGKFGKSVLNAGNKLAKMGLGAAAAGFLLLSKRAIQLGSELSDVTANTGFATEEFQVFRGALIDAGGAAKSMEKAIVIMQKAVVQGSEGLTTYQRAFERIGLSVDDLRKMRPEDQFKTIGKAIAGATDQQGALTAAIEIFGQKNAGRLIEVFKRLDKEGYGKMAEDIRKTYGIMDAETQAALDKAADTIERFKNKATIKVGELIAGEADGAAMKKLGFTLMEKAADFGIGLAEGFMDAVAIGRNAFGAFADFFFDKMSSTIGLIGTLIKISFAEALNPMIAKLNQIPKINIEPIDTEKLNDDLTKDLEKGNKSFFQYFDERQAKQEKFEIGYDPAKFWKEASEAEENKLEASRKAAKEARKAAEAEIAAITASTEEDGEESSKEEEASTEREVSEKPVVEEKTSDEKKTDLTGHDLRKAANIAGKEDGVRFEKLGGGGFQQFINGKKGKVFSEEQMQVGLQKQIDKDGSEDLLEKINSTLEGKFVSQ
jgi:hypothetical protein